MLILSLLDLTINVIHKLFVFNKLWCFSLILNPPTIVYLYLPALCVYEMNLRLTVYRAIKYPGKQTQIHNEQRRNESVCNTLNPLFSCSKCLYAIYIVSDFVVLNLWNKSQTFHYKLTHILQVPLLKHLKFTCTWISLYHRNHYSCDLFAGSFKLHISPSKHWANVGSYSN